MANRVDKGIFVEYKRTAEEKKLYELEEEVSRLKKQIVQLTSDQNKNEGENGTNE